MNELAERLISCALMALAVVVMYVYIRKRR